MIFISGKSFKSGDTREIGYEYLNSTGSVVEEANGTVIHIWNLEDDYFFDKNSGIQFSNYFQEYWTHNVFCGGYKDILANSSTRWVYKCNDALPFNWNIKTDNLTYVNFTGWRDINIGVKDVRVGIRYHLEKEDKNISVQLSAENIGTTDINNDIGFAWRVNNIQIDGDHSHDYIIVGGGKNID